MAFYNGTKALYDVILGVKQSECPCNVGSRYFVRLPIRCAYCTQDFYEGNPLVSCVFPTKRASNKHMSFRWLVTPWRSCDMAVWNATSPPVDVSTRYADVFCTVFWLSGDSCAFIYIPQNRFTATGTTAWLPVTALFLLLNLGVYSPVNCVILLPLTASTFRASRFLK